MNTHYLRPIYNTSRPKIVSERWEDKVTKRSLVDIPSLVISSALAMKTCNHLRPCLPDCYAILEAVYPAVLKGSAMTVLLPDLAFGRTESIQRTLQTKPHAIKGITNP